MKAFPIVLLATLVLAGCNESSQTKSSADGKSNVATAPADYVDNLAKAQKRAVKTVDITTMNKAVESFFVHEGHYPNDLLELVEKRYLPRIPTLPGTATWDYDTNTGVVSIMKN